MPAALERKLRREADKDPKIKDKDAYVYGTLRKTGWKPSTQKKMSDPSKLVRLARIDGQLDHILRFAYGDEDEQSQKRKAGFGSSLAKTGALVGTGAAGTFGAAKLHGSIMGSGGYGANLAAGREAFATNRMFPGLTRGAQYSSIGGKVGAALGNPARAAANVPKVAGEAVSAGLSKTGAGMGKLMKYFSPNLAAKLASYFDSKKEEVRFFENILEPFGAQPKTKILDEAFPAGMSPAAALRLPFPQLMQLLKQREILRQQFPGFSMKLEKLIELNSRLDELQFIADEDRASNHKSFKQAAGLVGVGGVATAGALAHREVMKKYGSVPTLARGSAAPGFQNTLYVARQPSAVGHARVGTATAYRGLAKDVQNELTNRIGRATRVGKFTYNRLAQEGSILQKGVAAARGVGAGLRHLSSQLDTVIEFGVKKK